MIKRNINYWMHNRFLTIFIVLLISFIGYLAMKNTPMDAIPNIGENQVIVYANWAGRSPKDIEDQVTYPLTIDLMGLPNVKDVRSASKFGLSMIYIIFEDGVDFYWARTRILEKLDQAKQNLPEGVVPVLGPDGTGLGQIYWYTVENGYYCPEHPKIRYEKSGECSEDGTELIQSNYNLQELRALQDWDIKYQLSAVQDVAEVASVGGFIKQYQIDVNPNKLLTYDLSINQVVKAVKQSNLDVGAKVIEEGDLEFIVRGIGFLKEIQDIEEIVLKSMNGTPVYLKNIASVTTGPEFRRGALDKEGADATGGMVLMRYGSNPLKVIRELKTKIIEIEKGLPAGVKIVSFYDRTELIERSIGTLKSTLLWQIIITIVVIMIFLLHFRTSLIISLVLPLGILITFIFMYIFKVEANIMSLGGIAIAVGVMVDAGIVLTENIYRSLLEEGKKKQRNLTNKERLEVCKAGAKEVAGSIVAAILTTIVSFLPVFTLPGQSGRLFRPLAFTKTFTMIGATIIVTSLVPVLSYYLLRGKLKPVEKNFTSSAIKRIYQPLLKFSLKYKAVVIVLCLALFSYGIFVSTKINKEFMPPLDEGHLLFMPVTLPGVSLTKVNEIMKKQDIILKSFPEVEQVVGKLGRAESATDPAPVSMIETIVDLKPKSEWRAGMTKKKLISEMNQALKIPGVSNIWTQPIRNRIDMLSTGIQTPVGIKVFGDDIKKIQEVAIQIETEIGKIPSVTNVYAERIGSRPYIEIIPDRRELARYGIKMQEVQSLIMTGIGGMNISTMLKGRERYPIRVRFQKDSRDDISSLKRLPVQTASGRQIPLAQIAEIKKKPGPAMIAGENTQTYSRVFINTDPDQIGVVDFVEQAKQMINQKIANGEIQIPAGYFIEWSGQYEAEVEASQRLKLVVPIVLLIILVILFVTFRSFSSMLVVTTGLPVAMIGGIILLYFMDLKMSVAVWVGFIALMGIATDNAVVFVKTLDNLFRKRKIEKASQINSLIIEGGLLRIRPIIMTTVTTILALVPIMLSSGTGSEVMKPMAIPTIGGLFTVTLTNTLLVPILYAYAKKFEFRKSFKANVN
ncbi:MAG: CusA/CzcA family heavy metal efflux RND transporter [Candidatus Cloacimonetes bacterium]|nr:CusA/CzcA family heavy metal efflux RND transporter [Candidatus Cloacimonadota bacterium]